MRNDGDAEQTPQIMYDIVNLPGRGKGMVAVEDIPEGTRILEESPVIAISEGKQDVELLKKHVSQQVDSLTEPQRQLFFSLHNLYPYQDVTEKALGIIRTVGLPIDAFGSGVGICLEACRINHACDNNAQKNWNQNIDKHTVHALRDISKGEEITIFYLGLDGSRETRQRRLREKFGFLCSCRLCSLPAAQSEENDKMSKRIDELDELIGHDGMRMNFSVRTLRYADERLRLCTQQGEGSGSLARTYLDAAQITIANGDLARGRIFAERAVKGWTIAFGSDSENVITHESLVSNPASLDLYGLSMKWRTSVDDIPTSLNTSTFEDWLWRRESPPRIGQSGHLTNLRNPESFPDFRSLPNFGSVDLDYYAEVDGTYRPSRHWCFLGEIIDSTTLPHLELELADVNGQRLPLHFYTESRGDEVAPSQIQKGHTVALLYAQRKVFVYGKPGIRHEDPKMLMIFPMSLKKLMDLNDQMQCFFKKANGASSCHGCGKKTLSMKKCGRCSSMWYCNEACQATGWTKKGHKADCRLLKDSNLRGLFLVDWNEFTNQIQFPLQLNGEPCI